MSNGPSRAFRGILMACAVSMVIWALIITTCSAQAQGANASFFDPEFTEPVKRWCWEQSPWCEPTAHAAITLGFSATMDLTGIMDGDDARWIPVGFYVAKEFYDNAIRAPGVIPWEDTALDLAGVGVGWWVSGLLFGEDDEGA